MSKQNIAVSGGLRTSAEKEEAGLNKSCFDNNPDTWEKKIENFTKYVRRQNLTRLFVLYEIFKKVLNVKGSIIECGVNQGFGIMTWSKLSAILEPVNLTRRIYGFDTFEGFPELSNKDMSATSSHVRPGDLSAAAYDELIELIRIHDSTRFLGHVQKVELIKGDAIKTIPNFIEDHPHLIVSLLFLDFDIYKPTIMALEHFVPRMPKGAIIAFDELDNPLWPGETQAMIEFFEKNHLRIEKLSFDPYVGYAVID
ncbi:MAG: class I SAM-dependent methyltransferase [Bacteroidetes bacterium]|nr:class I SAM-dependent methyltransferase [Bacteroidota bacterium]